MTSTTQVAAFKRVKTDYTGDLLDGKKLKGGERIEIKWPDTTVTEHKVSRRDDYDACIKIVMRGVRLTLRLTEIPKILVRRKV